jgi:hypothetical protein
MGILQHLAGPLGAVTELGTAVTIVAGFFTLLVLSVVLNVLRQLLFKNPNEPPVVFHWFPVIGSTIWYGMDPYGFFFDCRDKVLLTGPESTSASH